VDVMVIEKRWLEQAWPKGSVTAFRASWHEATQSDPVPESLSGLLLYPSANGLAVNMRLRNNKTISMPLQKAFGLIQQQLRGPFLPIIKRGDLRDFKELTPCLHLNALVPNKAGSLSRFSQRDIAKALAERSNELQLAAHLLGA